MNSIKLKLIIIYVSVVFIVMTISGTFMLFSVRNMEIERAREQLRSHALAINYNIVQPWELDHWLVTPEWGMIGASDYDVEGIILGALGVPIAPFQFLGFSFNDSAIAQAVNREEGFSVGSIGMDLSGTEQQWITFALPVTRGDTELIV